TTSRPSRDALTHGGPNPANPGELSPKSDTRMRSLVAFVTITSFALACGSGVGTHRPAAPVAEATPPKPESPTPADPSPNVLRDRRSEPGVRAPAKPLVLGSAKSAKCGKLTKGT